MQTFLPLPDFCASARTLDRQRLGKQRVEVLQILAALHGESKGWASHPAVRMWRGHVPSLVQYGVAICAEWRKRGYIDNCAPRIAAYAGDEDFFAKPPSWLGSPDFHASHRSNLLRKFPDHYRQFHWTEPHDLPYIWPTP